MFVRQIRDQLGDDRSKRMINDVNLLVRNDGVKLMDDLDKREFFEFDFVLE